jgi:rhodanese-related sulfurtransferase
MHHLFKPNLKLVLVFSMLFWLSTFTTAYAVPPPDFIFNIGSQLVQIFSVIVIFLSAILSLSYKYIKIWLQLLPKRKFLFIGGSIISIILISLGSAYFYGNYKQQEEYNKWLSESQKYGELQIQSQKIKRVSTDQSEKIKRDTSIDKLKIGETNNSTINSNENFISLIENPNNDAQIKFIEDYYRYIATKDLDKAYDLSKKSVDLETFKSWYTDTTKITLGELVRIDTDTSSLELTLFEGDKFTQYGVLMTLKLENNQPIQVANSQVRILAQGTQGEAGEPNKIISNDNTQKSFFEINKDYPLSINNSDFQKTIDNKADNYIVIDAREDLEYENGHFPDSTHIRFADIQAGKWIEIPDDKYIYVICWSGIRGKEVAQFLREKEIVATYLESGASGWFDSGGKWVGGINFSGKYSDEKYKVTFTTTEVKEKVNNGVFLVDTREPWKFTEWHIDGSVNIPIMYTPTIDLEKAFGQVPGNSTVITVCDGYVNCFDAKITGVELEARGNTFIGRYNKPWEYEN